VSSDVVWLGEESECASVLANVWLFLDHECTDESNFEICRHLALCEECLGSFVAAGRLKKLIAGTCGGEVAPRDFRWSP